MVEITSSPTSLRFALNIPFDLASLEKLIYFPDRSLYKGVRPGTVNSITVFATESIMRALLLLLSSKRYQRFI